MENQQTDTVTTQNQPLNIPPESDNNENGVERARQARIDKIKQKVLPGFRITLLVSLIIYLAMFVIGILGVHHCPVEENIPLFLIATGALGIITKLTTYMREHLLRYFKVGYMESSFYTVETVFLVLGSYWVYKEYPPSYIPDTTRYCKKSVYMLAFVYLTILLGILLAAIAGFVFFLGCIWFSVLCSKKTEERTQGGSAA